MNAERPINSRSLFFSGLALLPLLVVAGSVRAYAEPKLVLLMFLTMVCLLDLLRRAIHDRPLVLAPPHIAMLALTLLQLPSMYQVANLGLALTTLMLQLSIFVISIWMLNSEISLSAMARAIAVAVTGVACGALAMMLFRLPVISSYSPFGSTIGLKNGVAVFLAQCVPFLLYPLCNPRSRHRLATTLFGVLLIITLWIIFAYRTRSAWWMLLIYLVVTGALSMRSNSRGSRRACGVLVSSAALAALLCAFVPGELRWRSATPYLDSLATLGSLEHSNGRDKLWRVALDIVDLHPWTGIGLGNYPALWPRYMNSATVDPKSFAFLRNDLPLFNDYLQAAVERGLPAGILFTVAILSVPLAGLLQRQYLDPADGQALAALSCAAIAVDACFDSPFSRPECALLFAAAAGIAMRGVQGVITLRSYRALKIWYVSTLILVASIFSPLLGSVLFRRHFAVTGDPGYLALSWRLWPWSSEWNSSFGPALRAVMDAQAFQLLVERRLVYWPEDPESHLMLAQSLEQRSRYDDVFGAFRRAIVTVPGGRCYHPAYLAYDRFIRSRDLASDPRNLSEDELSVCR